MIAKLSAQKNIDKKIQSQEKILREVMIRVSCSRKEMVMIWIRDLDQLQTTIPHEKHGQH